MRNDGGNKGPVKAGRRLPVELCHSIFLGGVAASTPHGSGLFFTLTCGSISPDISPPYLPSLIMKLPSYSVPPGSLPWMAEAPVLECLRAFRRARRQRDRRTWRRRLHQVATSRLKTCRGRFLIRKYGPNGLCCGRRLVGQKWSTHSPRICAKSAQALWDGWLNAHLAMQMCRRHTCGIAPAFFGRPIFVILAYLSRA